MKDKFQSKSVPLGTRTIWRYLSALFLLLTLSIGNVWAAGTAIASLNFNEPTTLPSAYTYSSTNTPAIATFQSLSCINVSPSGGSTAPTFSGDNSAAPTGGKRWLAFQPAEDCSVTIKVGKANDTRTFYVLDKDHSTTSSYVSSYNPTAKNVWENSWVVNLKGGTWYAIIGSGSNCYIAAMSFVGAAKTDPTITFNDGAYTVGGSALDLSSLFSSNSDGAVTYTVKTAGETSAAIDGKYFTASAAGTATVTASQAATSTYNAATADADIVVSVPSTPTHEITYTNLKGSDVSAYPTEFYEGVGIASFDPLADVTDFHFNGWSPASIGTDVATDVEMTATWVAAYNVSFALGTGASGTAPAGFQKWEGATFELPGQGSMVAPSGKAFDGWKANGTGDKLAANAEYTMGAAAVEFVAQWKSVPTVIFDWAKSGSNGFSADNTNLNAEGQGAMTVGTSIVGRKLGSNNVDNNNAGYKLGNNDVCIEIQGTSAFEEGDTVVITGKNGGSGDRCFAVAPSTTTDAIADTVLTNTIGSQTDNSVYKVVLKSAQAGTKIRVFRKAGSTMYIKGIEVIRPAAREIASTVITLSDVKVNDASISAANLATLTTSHTLALADEFAEAPVIKFNEHTVITYTEGEPATKTTDKVYSVTATENGDGKWQAQQTINEVAYTVTAEKVSAATVTYYDGATKLGEEVVAVSGNPADYADFQDKDFATFVSWYNNSDLADEHKIADISALTVTKDTTLYGKWTPAYATSINIEQWVLDNKKDNTTFRALLDARHYKYANLNDLDSLTAEKNEGDRNYPYLGQKIKTQGGNISFLLKAGSELHVKLGNVAAAINLIVDDEEPVAKSTSFDYTAGASDEVIKLATTTNGTVVFQQIMIDEAIAVVKLPANVTIDANGGTHDDDGVVLKYTGTPLVIADATPADAEHLFDGWYDGETKINAAAYEPARNVTLVAKYVLKPSPFSLTELTYQVGAGAVTPVGYEEGTYIYNVELPYAKSYDAITVAATPKEPTSEIKGGAISQPSGVPGAATFTVVNTLDASEQVYTVNFKKGAKDGVEIIRATHTDAKTAEVTGSSGGEADKNTEGSGKLGDANHFFGIKLAEGTFLAGDVLKIRATSASTAVRIYSDKGTTRINAADGEFTDGLFTYVLTDATEWIYLYRKLKEGETDMNPTVDYMAVTRPMNPVLTAIQFNSTNVAVTGTTVSALLPNGTNLGEMSVTPTIYWNGTGTAEVSGSWAWGSNTYTVTDKDGDATVYTITLTEDVLKYTVTYYDGSTNLGTENVVAGEHPTAAEIVAPSKLGKTFLGWSEDSEATDATDLNTITRTSAVEVKLYAIYASIDCSGTGVKFSMVPKPNDLTSDYQPTGTEEVNISEYATITNGEVYVCSNSTDKRVKIVKETSVIQLIGGENGYIHVQLACPLKENDVIRFENNESIIIAHNSSKTSSVTITKTEHQFVVPAAWEGKTEFFIWRSGNNVSISSIEVYRPALLTVSFDVMGHGSAPADLTDVLEGSKITAPTAPTNEDYAFCGWYKESTLENEWDFDNDVVTAATTLYAKWLDKSDATLKSLKYGSDEISLEDGVYEYEIALAAAVASVPALTAVTTNPSANAAINNAASFDEEGKATSTVVVTPEKEGAPTQTYTVNFSKLAALPQVDVTKSIIFDFSKEGSTSLTNQSDVVLANLPGINNDENFNSQALFGSFNKLEGTYFQGSKLSFTTTVPGIMKIGFRGTNNNARHLQVCVGDEETVIADWNYKGSNGDSHQTKQIEVPAGKVTLKAFEGTTPNNARIYRIEFLEIIDSRTEYAARELGTACYEYDALIIGAKAYEVAGVDAHGYMAFDEIPSGEIEAGKPYLFEAEGGTIYFCKQVGVTAAPLADGEEIANKGMYGTFSGTTLYQDVTKNYYYFSGRHIWKVNDFTVAIPIPAHRCYVDYDALSSSPAPAPAPGRRRVTLGLNGKDAEQTATDIDNLNASEKPVKLLIDGQLFIIRGEKMFDATGRLVK